MSDHISTIRVFPPTNSKKPPRLTAPTAQHARFRALARERSLRRRRRPACSAARPPRLRSSLRRRRTPAKLAALAALPRPRKTDGHISNAWVRYRAMNLWGGTCSKWGFVWRSEFVGDSCPNGAFMDMLKGSSVRIRGSVERGRTTPAVPSDYQTSN